MAYLIQTRGSRLGTHYALVDESCVLGRDAGCTIYDAFADHPQVSRRHCEVVRSQGEFLVRDLKSRNGTLLNGEMIGDQRKLSDGDRITICGVEFTFHFDAPTPLHGTETISGHTSQALIVDDAGTSLVVSALNMPSSSTELTTGNVSPRRKLQAVVEMLCKLGASIDVDQMLADLLDGLFRVFPHADRGFVGLKDGDLVVPRVSKNRSETGTAQITISRTLVDRVIDEQQAVLSTDTADDLRFSDSQSMRRSDIRSLVCAPLLDADRNAFGILQLDSLNPRRQFTDDDLELLSSIAPQAAIAVRHAQLHDESVKREVMDRDLELARRIQFALLPDQPPQVPGYAFFSFYEAAFQIGGDFYDYIPLPGGRWAVVVADAAGKGVSAALLMAKLSGELRTYLSLESEPAAAVARMNDSLAASNLTGRFVTLVLAVLDPDRGQVQMVNAGHMSPVLRTATGDVELLAGERRDLALGLMSEHEYVQFTCNLPAGASITIYTDGFSEANNDQDELYGDERLAAHVAAAGSDEIGALGQSIVDDVRRFVGDHEQSDDMCLVTFGRSEE